MIWRCGDRVLASSSKYQLKQEGTVVELVIFKLQGADSGEYSCDTGSQRTSAVLTVQGRIFLFKTFFKISHTPYGVTSFCVTLSAFFSLDIPYTWSASTKFLLFGSLFSKHL